MSQSPDSDGFLRRFTGQTRAIVWAGMGLTVAAAWALLAGMAWSGGSGLIAALCSPDTAATSLESLGASLVMWTAMALAMMLPTAAPMIAAYLDIAEAAGAKGKAVAPAGILAGGYVTVWLGFSLAATAAQAALRSLGAFDAWQGSVNLVLAGLILMLAGAYQFTPLKAACLSKCQRPMPFFMANWTEAPAGVYRLGLWQGLWCLGCCWALMLVMFAAGLMNLVWMAGLGLVMMAEKLYAESRAFTWGAGLIFLAGGAGVLIAALVR